MPVEIPTAADLAAIRADIAAAFGRVGEQLAALRGQVERVEALLSPTPAPQPQPTPAPQPAPVPGTPPRVTRDGVRLLRGGVPFRFAGVNLEHAVGCGVQPGAQPTDAQADAFFAQLGPQPKAVRIWVMPGISANWRANYRRVVEAASEHGHHLIVTLLNGQPHCTSSQVTDYPASLPGWQADWIRAVVGEHAGNPAVMAYECANEANEGHPNIGAWYGAVAALVRSLDPGVLVFTGGGHASNNADAIAAFVRRSGVDGFSLHDYVKTGISPRAPIFERAAELCGVPWYVGEFGYSGPGGGGDYGDQERNAARLRGDYGAYFAFKRLFGALYWDARFNQRETSTAYPAERTGLWRAVCDYRVPVPA